jgi:hypothetical protein
VLLLLRIWRNYFTPVLTELLAVSTCSFKKKRFLLEERELEVAIY